jgi:type IV pilus assembly protein PilB
MDLLHTLAQKNIIFEADIARIENEVRSSGKTLEEVLRERGINQDEVLSARGESLAIPQRTVDAHTIPFEILKYVPEESAMHYKFVPIGLSEGVLEVGILNPDNIEARDALNFISSKIGLPYKLFLITEDDFQKVLQIYKGLSGEVTKALGELEVGEGEERPSVISDFDQQIEELTPSESKGPGSSTYVEDAPVTKIVATILRYAIEGNASDIHVEHMGDKVRVRFRVDGELHTSLILPPNIQRAVVARIKILSNMKIDERRKPQDGRFSAKIQGREVDFRVSTFPAYYGEKVVMRILDKERGVRTINDLNFSPTHLEMIKRAIDKPYGIILISGPTGSGKSTTLYSLLNELDKETQNVISLEDPVEFNIDGVSQSQMRPEIEYTFAAGLRTSLRQDPDVIMVGEIRDKETAQLAIQAALTGHLVFSTIHTNTAVGVIPRLIDMGVDPYLIAPTLILSMAQRLGRQLCKGAGKPMPIEGSLKQWIEEHVSDMPDKYRKMMPTSGNLYSTAPSPECASGTRGRIALFEMFEMDKDIEAVINKNPTELEIEKVLRTKGMFNMQEDAIMKCAARLLPFEEVNALTT